MVSEPSPGTKNKKLIYTRDGFRVKTGNG